MMTKLITLILINLTAASACSSQEPVMNTKKHHTATGFRNTDSLMVDKSFKDLVSWMWNRQTPEPKPFPVLSPDSSFLKTNLSQPTLTWIGHSTFLIQIDGVNILTDPHFSDRASPVSFAGPKRYTRPAMTIGNLPRIDVVLISHDHYDHLDLPSVVELFSRQPDSPPVFLTGLKVKARLEDEGITTAQEYDWWESVSLAGFTFHCVPVQHFSGRSLTDRNSTLWCGWVAERNGYKIFFAGDTGYSDDFKQIHSRLGDMDLSLLPIGAYDPRWFMKSHHVAPEEAVQIHQDVHSRQSVGMHWGTFILTDEPVDEPPVRLRKIMVEKGLDPESFVAFQHGETRMLTLPVPEKKPVTDESAVAE